MNLLLRCVTIANIDSKLVIDPSSIEYNAAECVILFY